MHIFTLTTSIRSVNDPEYTRMVDDIGEDSSGNRRSLNMISQISQLADAIDFLFPPHILTDPLACLQRAFLSPRNSFVDEFNDFVLDALPGDYESYFSSDILKEADDAPSDAPEQSPNYLALISK